MSYRYEKEENGKSAIVIDGFDKAIAPSPHKGIANMQAVNISTESGEVMCSFARTQQSMTSTSATGTLTFSDSSHVGLSITNSNNRFKGNWITVSNTSHSGELANGTYYVLPNSGGSFNLASSYNGSALSGFTSGLTATISLVRTMSTAVAKATEIYKSDATTVRYRYYILDDQGLVWCYDTLNEALYSSADNVTWFLADTTLLTNATGIEVLNGWLHVFYGETISVKPTVNLGDSWTAFASGQMLSTNPHFAYVGHQGSLYYTDGNYLGKIFPNTSLLTGASNIQSYCSYTSSSTTGTIAVNISGSVPYNGTSNATRIPATFFPSTGGSNPSALTAGTIYYIKFLTVTDTFEVYAAASGGSALDVSTGKSGTLYFNTYNPKSAGGEATITFTPERLNLPAFEIATSIAEAGNIVVIGTKGNTLYPWNQVDTTPSDIIPLSENNCTYLLTVGNMVYAFVGNKGNIYLTNGSAASSVLTVPDYCAGIAGTQNSYVEPYFTWGGAMYMRGRVYFSILDQTSTKAGNCGGVWSFVPTQNYFFGQDQGVALRLENQNSYATYSGVATVLVPSFNQAAKGPQYWSAWYSSTSSATYGIDASSTTPSTSALIETDLIPTGTFLQNKTFEQIEYKLSAPLASGETVGISYRQNSTDAYVSLGTAQTTSATGLSGLFNPLTFQSGQWIQLKVSLNPITSTSSSFVRLKEVRIR